MPQLPFLARKTLRQRLSLKISWFCRHLPKPHMIQMDLLSPESAGRLPGAHVPLQPSHALLLGSSKALRVPPERPQITCPLSRTRWRTWKAGLSKRTRPAAHVNRQAKVNEQGQGLQFSAALSQAPWTRKVQPPVFKSFPFSWA